MLFNSSQFLIFFIIVTLVYYLFPKKLRTIEMLIASYFFYMCWNAKYVVLILFTTISTYLAALILHKADTNKKKKLMLIIGIATNISLLFFFKYFDFLIDNINILLSTFTTFRVVNLWNVLLPVGISFYTFQGLGYLIDVYRGECVPEKSLVRYALFVSFFPQLVAGPIERSKNLLGQIRNIENIKFNYDNLISGLILMTWGMFQKVVIADRVSIFVDSVYENLYRCGTIETIICMFAFSIQIYCDFSGYSSIAVGAAQVMGIHLMENFKAPYLSQSIAQFWRNWHISLSTWFKDYVYIPLGGNRNGKKKKYRNLIITFTLSGLWHGANWTFVIWGLINAIYQVIESLMRPIVGKIESIFGTKRDVFSYYFINTIKTFILTSFAWIFFRATSLTEAISYIKKIFLGWNPWVLFDGSLYGFGLDRNEAGILLFSIMLMILVDYIRIYKDATISEVLMKENYLFRVFVIVFLISFILVYGKYGVEFDSAKFIYFDF